MNALETLIAAKTLIDTPEKWTTGSYSRDSGGNVADLYGESACKFCSIGAINRVSQSGSYELDSAPAIAKRFLAKAIKAIKPSTEYEAITDTVIEYNDLIMTGETTETRHARVMQAFDKAIEIAKEAK